MNTWKKFTTTLKAEMQNIFMYPGMILIWVIDMFFSPLVMLLVWTKIGQTSASVGDWSTQITSYYILLPIIILLTGAWNGYFFTRKIQTGEFSTYLLKPYSHLIGDLANNFSEKVLKIAFLLPITITCIIVLDISTPIKNLPLTFLALSLGFILNFLQSTLIGYAAFWLIDTSGLDNLVDIGEFTLGGRLVPFFLLPSFIKPAAAALPFRYFRAFPTEVLAGSLTGPETIIGFTAGCIWLLVFTLSCGLLWKRGLKKYSAVGG